MFGKTVLRGLAAMALMASVTTARAGDIVYNIVDYPVNQADQSSGTDTVSGTIITDGTLGSISAADILGGSLKLSGQAGSFTAASIVAGYSGTAGDLVASPTELTLAQGGNFSFGSSATDPVSVSLHYNTQTSQGPVYDGLVFDPLTPRILRPYCFRR